MKMIVPLIASSALLLAHTAAEAQSGKQLTQRSLSYTYGELRLVDADNDGDGISIGGSYELAGPWILVGSYASLDFDGGVDFSLLELGGGYVWGYTKDWDLFGTVSIARGEVDGTFGSDDETGFSLAAGTRGLLTPQLEVRGSVNHINLDDSDTFLELAADFYFTKQFAAGLSLEFAGDLDVFTVGARYFFR